MQEYDEDILIEEPELEVDEPKQEFENEIASNSNLQAVTNQQANQTQERAIKKATDSFASYSNNNLSKVYKKYDVVQTYVPKKQSKQKSEKEFETFVGEQNSYEPQRETVAIERVEQKPQSQSKASPKIWMFSVIAIFIMLGGLAIYNAFNISSLSNQIEQTQTSITDINKEIKQVVKDIDQITDTTQVNQKAEELGFKEVTSDNSITIETNPKNELETYEPKTNFFDEICNFFRRLFG